MTYNEIDEVIQNAKSLNALRKVRQNVLKAKEEDLSEMYIIQWGALGGTLTELAESRGKKK